MELILAVFLGLVLFGAFGKPAAKLLRAAAPWLPGVVGVVIRLVPIVVCPGILLFAVLLGHQERTWGVPEHLLLFLCSSALCGAVVKLCSFLANTLQAVVPAALVAEKFIFDDVFKIEDEDEEWMVSFDKMRASVHREDAATGQSHSVRYLLKRNNAGEWFARENRKGTKWVPLEDLNERLPAMVERLWRKSAQ